MADEATKPAAATPAVDAAAAETRQRILGAYKEMLRFQFYGTVGIVVLTIVIQVPGFIT